MIVKQPTNHYLGRRSTIFFLKIEGLIDLHCANQKKTLFFLAVCLFLAKCTHKKGSLRKKQSQSECHLGLFFDVSFLKRRKSI